MASSYLPNYFIGYLATRLEAGTATSSIVLDRLTTLNGETLETADLSILGRGVITVNPDADGLTSFPESIAFTGITGGSDTLTGATRGLDKAGESQTELMNFYPVGTPVIVSFGTHQIADLIAYFDSQTVSSRKVVVAGLADVTVAQGNLLYFKGSSGRWAKADSTDTAKSESVLLGIAQGAGTAGNLITDGVLLFGLDSNQSGMTGGNTMYASDTPGAIGSSAGTLNVPIGVAKSTTELYFNPMLGVVRTTNVQTLQNKTFTSSVFTISINTQTNDYTLVLTDDSKLVQMNKASGNTLTVPPNSSVAFAIGSKILVRQMGAGQTTIAAGIGVTINSAGAALKVAQQYGMAVIVKVATDTWSAEGNLTT